MSVGSFFTCAVERRRERARGAEQALDVVAREVGDGDEVALRRRAGRAQVVGDETDHVRVLLGRADEQDAVDLVHLDELHLDALVAGGGQVLADVVGADRQLAVAAVDEDGELDAVGPAVVEERLDRGADRAAGVEDVVDEDDRPAVEREVELRRADERLRRERRLAGAHHHVVAVEGDVDRAEGGRRAGALLDEPREPLRERDAARLDPDERDVLDGRVALDDLVGDSRKGPAQRFRVEDRLPLNRGVRVHPSPFRPRWTGLKGYDRARSLAARPDGCCAERACQLRGTEQRRPVASSSFGTSSCDVVARSAIPRSPGRERRRSQRGSSPTIRRPA